MIAHEVGHHVQNQLGILPRSKRCSGKQRRPRRTRCRCGSSCRPTVTPASGRTTPIERGGILESGDIEEALNAAAAVGDDRLQKRSQGYVVPETFTHGSSAQRVGWFKRGLQQRHSRGLRHLRRRIAADPLRHRSEKSVAT